MLFLPIFLVDGKYDYEQESRKPKQYSENKEKVQEETEDIDHIETDIIEESEEYLVFGYGWHDLITILSKKPGNRYESIAFFLKSLNDERESLYRLFSVSSGIMQEHDISFFALCLSDRRIHYLLYPWFLPVIGVYLHTDGDISEVVDPLDRLYLVGCIRFAIFRIRWTEEVGLMFGDILDETLRGREFQAQLET